MRNIALSHAFLKKFSYEKHCFKPYICQIFGLEESPSKGAFTSMTHQQRLQSEVSESFLAGGAKFKIKTLFFVG